MHRWRLGATRAELPDRDAELLRLVGEIVLNAGAGEHDDPDRQHVQHLIVALERGGAAMLGPVGGKADLGNAAVVGPAGRDLLGAFWRFAVHQHHVGVLRADLVELRPDQLMVVEVEPAGQCDLRSGGQQHLAIGAFAGGDEVAAVDHRRGELAMVDA